MIGLDGSIIRGLYAAGEVAGMAGGHMNGRSGLEGTMIGPSLFAAESQPVPWLGSATEWRDLSTVRVP